LSPINWIFTPSRFEKIRPTPSWAEIKDSEKGDTQDELDIEENPLLTTGKLLEENGDTLPSGTLNIRRVKDANFAEPSNVTNPHP
jgi:hypothetical protein